MEKFIDSYTYFRVWVAGESHCITTRLEDEVNKWLEKGKAPVYVVEGKGVYSEGKKMWKKIVKVEKITNITKEVTEEIEL